MIQNKIAAPPLTSVKKIQKIRFIAPLVTSSKDINIIVNKENNLFTDGT